ncbi:SusC/RagA family TonB-linked outer membrane protein [Flavivirga rizhaonensis]|uniref:SusC/RagA family TonB-linked outer membrane protein n=2 Tax=Flavivirga rizhaonensis TaxID=2559571 RepID=A0A4S1E055_9FLAO|nr:SusC/RagA family TonB-linked outer membrane protein [Flavivirga rizhaonensis]
MKQTNYSFVYEEGIFNKSQKINVKKGNIRTYKLLQESLSGGDYTIIVTANNNIIIKEITRANKRLQKKISGKIIDEKGLPIPGTTILIKGTKTGTASDFNGFYSLLVPDPANVLVFSSLGFENQEVTVGNQTTINITLKESISQLEEVTINAGYYNTSKRETTGSIAKISAKTIEKQPVNNPIAAMQGHMAGVNIRQTSGVPGSGFDIEIRGKNFLNGGTTPLFIIDGVPYGSLSLEAIGSLTHDKNVSPLNAINPADIKSIEVLKDADATAIYGSRGANGVVLITTKKGTSGKTKVMVNVINTFSKVTRLMDLLNTEQYLELRKEALNNIGFGFAINNPDFNSEIPEVNLWDQNRYTNWQKVLIGNTAYRNNIQLSLSGGSEQTQFLFSGAYQKETTVFPGDANYKKASLRSNINHQSSNQLFKINLSTSYSIENNQLPLADFTYLANTLEPNAPALYDNEGNLNWENNTFNNPLASLEREYRAKTNTLIANTVLSYQLHTNLELKTNLGYNNYQLESYITYPSTAFNPSRGFDSSLSSHTTNSSDRQSWIIEPQLNWQKQWGDIDLKILIGSTFQKQTTEQLVQRGTGFSSNNLILNFSAAETIEVLQNNNSEYRYQAFFGRINFNFKDKYILNLTGRRDGSSRFGSNKLFGNFGAIGGAWIFSEEVLFNDNSIISFGKIRGSYGTTGSDNIGDYKFLDTYDVIGYDYNGINALEPTGIFNPNYGWEENKKLEFALELGFFKDRILLNPAWYQNRSSNQLVGIPLATTTGFNSLTGNFDATVENTGFELDVRTINIQKKHFNWSTTFNLTVPKNKLLKFPNIENSAFANTYRIGKPLTETRFFHALGVNPDTGFYEFEDYNNDGSITTLDDKNWFEDLAPKFYGGLGNTLTYKNVSLNFFFQFKKQKGRNYLAASPAAGFRFNGPIQLLNRWQEPGDIAPIQIAGFYSENQSASSAIISDASFIRLRNIALNYKVPTTWSYGMDIDLYLQGQNLLTITNYEGADPEQPVNRVLPPLKQISLGARLGF